MANIDGRRFQWINLTQKRVDAAVPGPKERTLWDGKIVGFGVRIRRSGSKSYQYVYRKSRFSSRRVTIGSTKTLTLEQAREKAHRLQAAVKVDGEDPAAQKTRNRGITFEDAYRDYQKDRLWERKESYQAWTRQRFRADLLPKLAKQPVALVTRSAIREITDAAKARGSSRQANNIHKAASAFFTWCVERELITVNPLHSSKLPTRTVARDRVLEPYELMQVWDASLRLGPIFSAVLRLLILLGQRKNEVVGAEIKEFNFVTGTWTIPRERTKNGCAQIVHLCPLAIEILLRIPRVPGQRFLFQSPLAPTYRPRPLSGLNQRVDACKELMAVPGWCIHDLRRTVATQMAALNVQPHVLEVVLNHKSGFRSGVAGIYNRHRYFDESLEAWNKWGTQLQAWIKEPPAKPVAPVPIRHDDSVEL